MSRNDHECPVCFESIQDVRQDPERDILHFDCPRCGRFRVTEEALADVLLREEPGSPRDPLFGPRGSEKRANLSAWLLEHPGFLLDSKTLQQRLHQLPTPLVLETVDEALLALGRETRMPGHQVNLNTALWRGRLRVFDSEGVLGWAHLMEELGLVRIGQCTLEPSGVVPVSIAARGWERLRELSEKNPESPQAFVAMWFDSSMTHVYDEALAPAIEAAGYRPHRVDRQEFNGKIDNEIVAQIRRSRFVVADFTGHRAGVYWEAGFAEGLGLPVTFTCRKDDLENLHFDVRQNNTIDWEDLEELKKRLHDRIEAVLGRGPVFRNDER